MKCMYCGNELTAGNKDEYICQSCRRLGLSIIIPPTYSLKFTEIEEAYKVLEKGDNEV